MMNRRSIRHYIAIFTKGMGMGAADVVPGVSGGTIALITGVYEELISSLRSINLKSLKLLFRGDVIEFFNSVNGLFLSTLFAGIALSIFSLARVMKWFLINHPVPVWSFFFGLIFCSAWLVLRSAGKLTGRSIAGFFIGIVVSLVVTGLTPATTPEALWFVFISGAIGICAMILPGISGAFILILLGKYLYILTAVEELNIPVILVFIGGAATGLILFSNLLGWLLNNFRTLTIATLSGFMLGSLKKVWPWRIITEYRISDDGHMLPVTEKEVLPGLYAEVVNSDPYLTAALIMFIAGVALPLIIETLARKKA